MGLASLFRKRSASPTGPRFRYAVVGLGHIAGYFIDALADSQTCSAAALISGDAAKAQKLATKRGIAHSGVYANFEAICKTAEVHAVYLALPVSMHRAWTERAAAAGMHALCEKPMAPTAADARAMVEMCGHAGVLLSIAYRCPHTPLHQQLRAIVASGVLGASLRIESGFGFELKPGWRDAPALAGGGSLYDVGVYPLNAARFLLGEEPSGAVDASATCDAKGLEREVAWTSVFPSGARAVCRSSYLKEIPDTLRITGESGSLLLDPAFSHRAKLRLRGEYRDMATGRTIRIDEETSSDTPSDFRLEAEQLAAAVRGEAPLLTPGEDGLADMIAIEAIYAAAGVGLTS